MNWQSIAYRRLWILLATASLVPACGVVHASKLGVESQDLRLTLREDLNGVESLVDLASGRQYGSGSPPAPALYQLLIGRKPHSAARITSAQAARRRCVKQAYGLEIVFEHEGKFELEVRCKITARRDRPGISWGIKVTNGTGQPLSGVAYPVLDYEAQLGASVHDDAIVYPAFEGLLLHKPAVFLMKNRRVAHQYPGRGSSQFLYFFDESGGIYLGAHDTAGWPKTPEVTGRAGSLRLSWVHGFPSEVRQSMELPYEVVLQTGGGTWQHGADLYRDWAQANAPWCASKLHERDVPPWLRKTNVFLNFSFSKGNPFDTVQSADERLKAYRQLLGCPVVACAFGWEQHGAWIGPDYFPPRGGERYWRELARRLAERRDHLHVFTSGFRWGVRKPLKEDRSKKSPRVYTDWDGTSDFMARGRDGAAINAEGKMVFQEVPWADNYILCAASNTAREVLNESFQRLFDLGIAGVDLDQNLGGDVHECYSPDHGHPVGRGVWQYEAMRSFLAETRRGGRARHPDCFIGVEEPCEAYIPWIDIVHGRAFTDTAWPASEVGSHSIPLHIYLYHEHQLNYAGWIDAGFSPAGDERLGLGRAFLFGMQLGVRINSGVFRHEPGQPPSEPLLMLRDAGMLMSRVEPYLLAGRMLHDPRIIGSPELKPPEGKFGPRRRPWPVRQDAVQATVWRSAAGNVCYAVANLSGKPVSIRLEATANGTAGPVQLTRINPAECQIMYEKLTLPAEIPLDLGPWQLCCLEQTPANH